MAQWPCEKRNTATELPTLRGLRLRGVETTAVASVEPTTSALAGSRQSLAELGANVAVVAEVVAEPGVPANATLVVAAALKVKLVGSLEQRIQSHHKMVVLVGWEVCRGTRRFEQSSVPIEQSLM